MAGIRLSGLNSGMDTESIISQLVSAKKVSVNSMKKSQIKLSWKVDAWKGLNSKIYNLYTGTIDKLRYNSAYEKKKSVLSDNGLMDVTAGAEAVDGTQTVAVESLAKAGYLTGAKLESVSNSTITQDSFLSDLGVIADGTKSIKINGQEIAITEGMKVSELVNELKTKGNVNASFDATQGRFFISAKNTGEKNDFTLEGDTEALNSLGLVEGANPTGKDGFGAVRIDGSDAVMYLNGAKFTSDTNAIIVNGTTYTLKAVSEKGTDGKLKEATITTSNDYDGIYDVVKNFLKGYNELIKEMDKMYNAASAKDYEPLLSEEKEALTETEVQEWEKKIKDSLLRKDTSLGSVINTMTSAMSGSINIDGKEMFLADFGIATLGYFNSEENERHMYHIDGDQDDGSTASKTDVLKSKIASDPEMVKKFFTELSNKLYSGLTDSMARVEGFKSKYKVYNDKQMETELNSYKSKISFAEEALTDYEDKWYAKFAAMEKALGNLSTKQTAVSSLLGGMGY